MYLKIYVARSPVFNAMFEHSMMEENRKVCSYYVYYYIATCSACVYVYVHVYICTCVCMRACVWGLCMHAHVWATIIFQFQCMITILMQCTYNYYVMGAFPTDIINLQRNQI